MPQKLQEKKLPPTNNQIMEELSDLFGTEELLSFCEVAIEYFAKLSGSPMDENDYNSKYFGYRANMYRQSLD